MVKQSSETSQGFNWKEIAKVLNKVDTHIQEAISLLDELPKEYDFSPVGVSLCNGKLKEAKGWLDGLA